MKSRMGGARTLAIAAALLTSAALVFGMIYQAMAASPATASFERTWQRTDQPVGMGAVDRTWLWGPAGFTGAMTEPYVESPGGERTVQYFDKSRMEDNAFRATSPWDVTNGLLVVELVTGKRQVGDDDFTPYSPAEVNVAGDADDPTGPTYQTMAGLLNAPALPDGATITQRLDRAGNVTNDSSLATYGVTAAYHVVVPGIDHRVASPFWQFMNASGTVYENGVYVDAPMFLSPFYATGLPITEAYWANVKVAGTYQDVLLQCFERRCLTYTPGNPEGWQVEAGNVGQHYYTWRYGQLPNDEPAGTPGASPTATATEPGTPSPTATATEPVDGTPPAGPTAEPTVSPTATAPGDEPTVTPTATSTETLVHEDYVYVRQWGGPVDQDAALNSPHSVAISDDGYVYITDWRANHVLKYAADGRFVKMWGASGTRTGEFSNPTGIAVDKAGNVYVSDFNNNRVQKFNSDGEYLRHWGTIDGTRGSGPGDFNGPYGIAIDSSGYVYVVDNGNDRVQKFDSDGGYVSEWGSSGVGLGQFRIPHGIAVDQSDVIYVTDYLWCRVQAFDTDGGYLGELDTDTTGGSCSFQFDTGIAVTADGVVYVVDSGKDRVQVFAADGRLLAQLGTSGAGPGEFNQPIGIAIDASGAIYVADFNNGRVQVLDARGNYLDEWSDGRRGWLADPTFGMTMDRNGNVYLADDVYDRIQGFDFSGNFQREFGESGSGVGQLDGVVDIAASLDGYIYAVDVQNGRVLKYRRNGSYVTEWSGSLNRPIGVAVDQAGNVYVADAGSDMIHVFGDSGSLLRSWGGSGDGDGRFNEPTDIAIHGDRVYVVDHGNNRVQVFDLDGNYLGQWGGPGDGDGEFDSPIGIAVDQDGFVYVVDSCNDRVQKFTANGLYLTQFGSSGSGAGKFDAPTRVEVRNGAAYVLDTGNSRIQVFVQPTGAV